jgi:APA family basic amino acid/polyamine antiporter
VVELGALKREIGLIGATAYAVGIIIGAGVYALIGTAAGYGGNSVWLSFVFAAVIASFTGYSYAKLSSAFPVSGGEYEYVKTDAGWGRLCALLEIDEPLGPD